VARRRFGHLEDSGKNEDEETHVRHHQDSNHLESEKRELNIAVAHQYLSGLIVRRQ
jgi:hypothetical protein